jgi:predicted nucleic acid-binding protein
MAVRFLIDTSVLTRLSKPAISNRLSGLEAANAVLARCTMTDLEIGSSASNASEWSRIQSFLDAYGSIQIESQDFHFALDLQRKLADAGLKGRKPPDLLIAAVAIRVEHTVLHYDRDFQHVASVSDLSHEWIVPAGSVD